MGRNNQRLQHFVVRWFFAGLGGKFALFLDQGSQHGGDSLGLPDPVATRLVVNEIDVYSNVEL